MKSMVLTLSLRARKDRAPGRLLIRRLEVIVGASVRCYNPRMLVVILTIAYAIVAVVFSLFRGWYAVTILVTGGAKLTYRSERKLVPPDKWHHWSWWAHEVFINFAGSMIGWATAYYLICQGKIEGLSDAFLLLVAIAGIFGFLPWLLYKSTLK